MPPSIALTVCILYILVLLILDKKENYFSTELWIPLIWFLILSSRMVSLWIGGGIQFDAPEAINQGSAIDRNIFIVLIFVGLIILFRRNLDWHKLLTTNKWIFIFLCYCLLSILWSDHPFVSFKRWVKEVGNIIMVLIIATDARPVEAFSSMLRRCAYIHIPLSIVLFKYFPALGRNFHRYSGETSIVGVTVGKNALGLLCFATGMFFCWYLFIIKGNKALKIKTTKLLNYFTMGLIFWMMIEANSATALFCFIIGILIISLTGLNNFRTQFRRFETSFIAFVVIFALLQYLFDISGFIISSLGRDPTLTGRTILWEDILGMAKNINEGCGYDSFWLGDRIAELWHRYWWKPTQAHNGYIETYLELGLIGLGLLIAVILSGYQNIKRNLKINFEFGRLQLTFLIVCLLYNITEAAFKGLHLMWFLFLLTAISYPPKLKTSKNIEKL